MKISTYLKREFCDCLLKIVACNENKQRVIVDSHVILTQSYCGMTAPKYLSLFFIPESKGQ